MSDNERWLHLDWLGFVQPVGVVVSAPALITAQYVPDANVAERQEQLKALLGEQQQVADLKAFLIEFLGWQPTDLRAPQPNEQVALEEYKETLSADWIAVDESGPFAHVKQVPNAIDLDALPVDGGAGWQASEQTKFERLLRESLITMGLLSNGKCLRLVYAPSGESTGHATFPFAALTEVANRRMLSALVMLLHADRVFLAPKERRLPAVMADSRRYQADVSNALSEQVLEALHLLLRGFEGADAASNGALLSELRRPEHLGELSEGLLTTLLRLIFLLYAEDKGLMPGSATYVTSYSVTGLFEQLRADEARYPDLMHERYGAWARLLSLFRLVFLGGKHGDFHLPRRHGDLFNPDAHPFLEGRARADHFQPGTKLTGLPGVSDGTVLEVLRRLLVLDGERLSYRNLDVEQLGTVYESMMGFELQVALGRSVAVGSANVFVDLDALLELPGKKRAEWLKKEVELKVSEKVAQAIAAASDVESLTAAFGRQVSKLTPQPLRPGSLYLQPGRERRRSGSHYTPRSLTEPIVRTTLEPMLESLGAEPTPKQILELKVCDPAMGSGAFLVAACRFLAERLKDAWQRRKLVPAIPPDEDITLHARRIVAQRCLYGVDKNPMAVQLSKLSLWLFTLAKDHPFTFLDHALKCGDSLVGLTKTQISRFTWEDDATSFTPVFYSRVDRLVQRGEQLRLQIHDLPDPLDTSELKTLNEEAEQSLETARLLGHLVVEVFFAGGSEKAKKERLKQRATQVHALFTAQGDNFAAINLQLKSMLESPALQPFHWELEFPEVFGRARDGFDSFIGNPPFAGKNGISEAGGDAYIPWLQTIHSGAHGNADLSAHFFRRAFDLLWEHGTFGLIATNTIAQGDTRASGLKHLLAKGGLIYAATRSFLWPGLANVAVSVVHVAKGRDREAARVKVLDGRAVTDINSRLRAKPERPDPVALKANASLSFQGSIVLGMGFVLTPDERDALVKKDKRNAERIFPYIGGEEVNTSPTQDFDRYVICFSDLPQKAGEKFRSLSKEEAKQWPDLYRRVEQLVKPDRAKGGADRDDWWLFLRPRPELYEARAGLLRCLVNSQVTKHLVFSFQPTDRIFAHTTYVTVLPDWSAFAVLQSSVHNAWARSLGSSMRQDLRYLASDCFESFPFPRPDPRSALPSLEAIGESLYSARAAFMKSNESGLTATYNALKDPASRDPQLLGLRELHLELDREVLKAYGWSDISVPPYTTPETDAERAALEAFEDEVLDRLFALNAERASLEAVAGPSAAKPKGSKKPKKPTKPETNTLDLDPE